MRTFPLVEPIENQFLISDLIMDYKQNDTKTAHIFNQEHLRDKFFDVVFISKRENQVGFVNHHHFQTLG